MTKLSKLSVLFTSLAAAVSVVALFLALNGCSNDEQQKELERQQRIERQEKEDEAKHKLQDQNSQQTQQPAPEQTSQPEPEQSPEPEMVTVYKVDFTYQGRVSTLVCNEIEREACGYTLTGCGDTYEYRCITNLRYQETKVEKKEEEPADTNN